MIKKIFKGIGFFLLVLIAFAFAAPFLFKGKIVELVKSEINKNINAKVDFKDVNVSFFRHFPKVAIGLDELQVTGNDTFSEDTLLYAKRLDAALNIMSVIRGKDMTIYSITVESPRVHAIINKAGKANWDIIKDTTEGKTATEEKPFKMELQQYAVHNAYINYQDQESDISSEVFNLDHEGSGDFASDLFTLKTSTVADAVTFTYNKIPFLYNTKASIDADIQIDNKKNIYSFNTERIVLNELQLSATGSVTDMSEQGYGIDIQYKAPSTDFKNLLSLLPAIYKNEFSKVKASGTAIFNGFVKGQYNDKQMPAYHIDMDVKDGFFQYSDLPKPVQHIDLKIQVDNPDGQTDNTVVNVVKGHIELDKEPFDFRLLVKKPVSNMFVDAAAKGKLDLSRLSQFVKVEKDTRLSGLLNADVYVKGNVTDIEQQHYDKFTAGGIINLDDFVYTSKDYPTGVKINKLTSSFTPAKVDLGTVSGQYLSTNFSGSGQVNNLLNYMLQNKPLNASLNVYADKLNLNDWMGIATDTMVKGPAAKPFVVPANLDVAVNAKVDKLHYDKVDIQDLSGKLAIKDETVNMTDVKGNALDGSIKVSGSYSTRQNKTKPDIALTYDVTGVDVQKTFFAFNTVQKLMPVGKFIAGKLTSQMTLKGKLGENMMPDMNTISGNGNLLLIEGFLSKFAPLDKIASTLNVKALEQISLKDIKNYFEFSNGKLLVKPFPVKVNNIDMEIGGLQGFDQSMDYIINMKLPRSMIGEKGNALINNMVSQVNNKGVPIKVGDVVNLNLKLGGNIKNPTVKTDLKQGAANLADQLKQQVTDFAKAKIDSTKQAVTSAVKDTISSVKKQVLANAKEELLKNVLGGKNTDSTQPRPKPGESLKGLMNNIFRKKAKDTTAK